ncbi:MAG TPA: hypothetical protein VFH99_00240 [Candidatus Saccharimonadales bacterium]|nr:hypothetical protein [Candidatus Saccharimonadales bacterium]
MDKGRIVHFEDDANLRGMIGRNIGIFSDSHEIVESAGDLSGALETVDRMHAGEVDVNVVLLDGNLDGGVGGSDAIIISKRIRELGLPVRIIGMSSQSLVELGAEVDTELNKNEFSGPKLIEIIDQLEEPVV